jgi:hypothetical protein
MSGPATLTSVQSQLATDGWALLPARLEPAWLDRLRTSVFLEGSAGQRCLLDDPLVRETSLRLRSALIDQGILPATVVAIQAIAFDKNPAANWKVPWHQDLMFPFARPVSDAEFTLPSIKEGIPYARPPRVVLEALLAVRLHLDDCDHDNGPLRVASGSHREGVWRSADLAGVTGKFRADICLAREGEALLMRPLLLHASSPATTPRHRRVLHFVYHTGTPLPEAWHRAIDVTDEGGFVKYPKPA